MKKWRLTTQFDVTADALDLQVTRYVDLNIPHSPAVISNIFKILCVGCRTLQHPQCYGFLGLYDPRLPALHQCYHCLLIDRPKDALMHLKRTAALRQAMHVALLEELFDELKLVERLADIGILLLYCT